METQLRRLGSAVCQLLLLAGCAGAPVVPAASGLPTIGPDPSGTPAASRAPSPTSAPSPPASVPSPSATPDEGSIPIGEPGQVLAHLLVGDDALWGVSEKGNSRTILKVDPETNTVEAVVEGLPRLPNPIHGMAVNGSLWITSWDRGVVTEYDAATGEELSEHPVGLHPIEPVYAFGDLWTLNHNGGSVSRIDTQAKEVVATIQLGDGTSQPLWATAGGDLLWVVAVTETIYGIDPQSNEVAREIQTGIPRLTGVGYFADRLLASSSGVPGVTQFDPLTGENLGPFELPVSGSPLEVDDRLWFAAPSGGDYVERLVALDAESLEVVDQFVLPGRFSAGTLAVAFNSFWVSGREGTVRVPAEALR